MQIRKLCLQYQLPSPLSLLHNPLPKQKYKSLVKSKIVDFWEQQLREEARSLKTLQYFKPEYMSLARPHPLWISCGSNPFEVNKAVIQARMLSGRYPTEQLSRHWTTNRAGICTLPLCTGYTLGSLEHILLHCGSLQDTRLKMLNMLRSAASSDIVVSEFIHQVLSSSDNAFFMQFLLDCSSLPQVIHLQQVYKFEPLKQLFYLSRTWCYNMHRSRMTQLGLFNYR